MTLWVPKRKTITSFASSPRQEVWFSHCMLRLDGPRLRLCPWLCGVRVTVECGFKDEASLPPWSWAALPGIFLLHPASDRHQRRQYIWGLPRSHFWYSPGNSKILQSPAAQWSPGAAPTRPNGDVLGECNAYQTRRLTEKQKNKISINKLYVFIMCWNNNILDMLSLKKH